MPVARLLRWKCSKRTAGRRSHLQLNNGQVALRLEPRLTPTRGHDEIELK